MVVTGLDIIKSRKALNKYPGNIGYLANAASVDCQLRHGIYIFQNLFRERLTKVFSPQHGLVGDVQDDMIESDHFHHPYFDLPVYSLYSETRKPTAKMLEGLDHVFIDLQDVGTRIYTYIYTMTYMMEACGEQGIQVIILDRPNPINGQQLEGNLLESEFTSFVGRHKLPVRHGMTIGEIAIMARDVWDIACDLEVIKMEGWKRNMYFQQTGLPWVLPSPNLATPEAALVFPATVIFEGTNISEGRGTTRSLELIGHPGIEPYGWSVKLERVFADLGLTGFTLRPVNFIPTFQKHQGKNCGGYQIHVTDPKLFNPWKVGQILCRELYNYLGNDFRWKPPPYEYEFEKLPFDVINGTNKLRMWVENNGSFDDLLAIEQTGQKEFEKIREKVLLYDN
ncbi:MAG: hypothetical protein DHS20C17_16210 [Cyclobacteriaceae bacterium]|nr:MAG: hypothetical protein DHS20C17_16210 [Cyclobacteriaceae bacterium]